MSNLASVNHLPSEGKPPTLVFCLMGPTASGKTALACELIQHFPFEIISIDSAMIYRGMDIGTAKPDATTLAAAPHHLIDIIDPPESYSAARCCEDVIACCRAVVRRGKIPFLVGGTMMYFRALQQGLSQLPEADESMRIALLQRAEHEGWDFMHQWLTTLDPISAARIHPHDTQRIQRALEVCQLTGKPLSALTAGDRPSGGEFNYINLLITPEDRGWLHDRIALRFKAMLAEGLIDESQQLIRQWSLTASHPAMRCVGYRQVFEYLQGEYDRAALVDRGIAATRQLAKRQLTWLRHWQDGHRVIAENSMNFREIVVFIQQMLDNQD